MRIPFDIIGSREKAVAVVEVPEEQINQAVEEIRKRHKNIKSILLKLSGREGVYRIYNTKLIWGEENTEVLHKEYGYVLKLDPKRVYFSPREGVERQKIAGMVKPGERVLVMFSGVGPYAIAIAKKQPGVAEIICVEINLKAVEYAQENAKLNKVDNKIKNYCWDVREACDLGRFDRIIMPLPESAVEFLDVASRCAKPGAIVHIYGISEEKTRFSDFEKRLQESARRADLKIKVIKKTAVSEYAPHKWKVRFDLKVC